MERVKIKEWDVYMSRQLDGKYKCLVLKGGDHYRGALSCIIAALAVLEYGK